MSDPGGLVEMPAKLLQRVRGQVGKARSLFVYLSFSAAANMIGMVTTLFMVRYVAPQEMGRVALVMGALMVTNVLISFGAENMIAIGKTDLGPAEYAEFRKVYSHFALISFAFWQVIAVLAWSFFHIDSLVLLIPLLSLGKFFVVMASMEYVLEQRALSYGLVQFFTALAGAIVTAALVLWVSQKAEVRVGALLLADFGLLAARYGIKPSIIASLRFHRSEFKRIALFGIPLMLSAAPAYLLNEGDKVVVAHQMGLAFTGIYGAAATIAGAMLAFIVALQNSVVPKVLMAVRGNQERALSIALRYAGKFLAVCMAFAVIFLLVYTLTAGLLLPRQYSDAIATVYVLVLAMLVRSFYLLVGTVTDYLGMTTQKLMGCVLGAATSLAAISLLIAPFGLVGAGVGVGAGYAVLGGWLVLCLKRREIRLVMGQS